MKKIILTFYLFSLVSLATAQPLQSLVHVIVEPDHADWTYRVGEEARFNIYVIKDNRRLNDITVTCEYGPEMFMPRKKFPLHIKKSEAKLKVPGMQVPGFQTVKASVEIDGQVYSGYTNIGYEPEKIEPTTTLPDDFMEFWETAIADARKTPLKPKVTLIPELCTPKINVYNVRIQNEAPGSYIYGILCIPKAEGKYPAILKLPPAGIRQYTGYKDLAEQGAITFEIGIHGIPVDLPEEVYNNLMGGSLADYQYDNFGNKDEYYFKRVILGCLRAVDFIYTIDEFDKERIGIIGGSQGGALTLATAALEPRIKYISLRYPAMCDMTGYVYDRAGGWPHVFKKLDEPARGTKIEGSKYYDAVNFARFIKIPGYYTWGYNDNVCPPTSTFSAYNVIKADKVLKLFLDSSHWLYPEELDAMEQWMLEKLNVK